MFGFTFPYLRGILTATIQKNYPDGGIDMQNELLIQDMIQYDAGMAKQIQHFLKVYEFARIIGLGEKLDSRTQNILETASIVHDIGIRKALELYGSSSGKYQEELGPAEAKPILEKAGCDDELISRVLFLIAHHHTYHNIEGMDYQILVEADFLVNLYEDQESESTVRSVYHKIFKTKTGRQICATMFGLSDL